MQFMNYCDGSVCFRKGALLRNNAVVLLASILLGLSKVGKSYEMIIIGRFLVGLNAGNVQQKDELNLSSSVCSLL